MKKQYFKNSFSLLLFLALTSTLTSCNKDDDKAITAISYTVSFDVDGGSAVAKQTVVINSKATKPSDPTKTGFTFVDWYQDSAKTKVFDFDTAITANTTIYAKWTAEGTGGTGDTGTQKYTVTFDLKGGTTTESNTQEIETGEMATDITPTKSGEFFGGWHTVDANFRNKTKFDFTTTITADITLTARWYTEQPDTAAKLRTLVDAAIAADPNVDLNYIDTSKIDNMDNIFKDKTTFNGDISGWDTSSVTSMISVFNNASVFDGDISDWDTSSVTRMDLMFFITKKFNGDISDWETSKVENMKNIFASAEVFNGDISDWDVSSVIDMNGMFRDAKAFNQDLNSWTTSKVEDMSFLFLNAEKFNGNISSWDVSNVTNMNQMFNGALAFNQDLNNWTTSKVTDMFAMFFKALMFDGDISSWNVSSVADMRQVFEQAAVFNQDISGWNVSSATSMKGMFKSAPVFNQDLKPWEAHLMSGVDDTDIFFGATAMEDAHKPTFP